MAMRKIPFDDFLNLVFCTEETGNTTRFCFVLGSGASKACGIPTGLELAARWAKEIREKFSPAYLTSIMADLQIKEDGLDPAQSENYFNLYYTRFYAQPSEGPKCLEEVMQNTEPSCGFYTLARLLMEPRHNLVLTTNFDSMVEDSLSIYAKSGALVIPHESLAHYIDVTQKKPMVVKLHRSLFFDPKNTNDGMDKLINDWTLALNNIFSIYTPLVIGYNGGDKSLMKYMLDKANTLRHGLYWFKRTCDKLPPSVQELLNKCDGHLIEIDEPSAFDWVMWRIGERKKYPDATEWLRTRAGDLSERYNKQVADFGKKAIDTTVKEDIKQRWRDQIEDATRKIKKNPKDTRAFLERAYAYAELGEYAQAIADYTKAIELNPQDAAVYNNRGATYASLEQYEQAIADYTKAIELNPQYDAAYNNRGTVYNTLKQYDKAIEDFTKAIELNPQYFVGYNNRGNTYGALKQYEQAIADYTKAIELNPQFAAGYHNRGIAYNKLKQYDKALKNFTTAISLLPEYPAPYRYRAEVYDAIGQPELAAADRAKFKELTGEDAT
jgi:tetratricopeptide (TPR) repeat protein